MFSAGAVGAKLRAAHERWLAAGAPEGVKWWAGIVEFDLKNVRMGGQTGWATIVIFDDAGVRQNASIRILGEFHSGTIAPSTDAGIAEAMAASPAGKRSFAPTKRDRKPAVQIMKWAARVPTADDGVTILTDDHGAPLTPSDDTRSRYFEFVEYLNMVFTTEIETRVELGKQLLKTVVESTKPAALAAAKADGRVVTADSISAAFNASLTAPRAVGDIIILTGDASKIRGAVVGGDKLLAGATVVSSVKIVSLIQTNVSDKSAKNAGAQLPNPITRITMNFDIPTAASPLATGAANFSMFDGDLPFEENGRRRFEPMRVDGAAVTDATVHKAIGPGSEVDGIVCGNKKLAVCFSNMGISIPITFDVLVVRRRAASAAVGFDDLYGDALVESSAAPAGAAVGQAAVAAAPDVDGLDELGL